MFRFPSRHPFIYSLIHFFNSINIYWPVGRQWALGIQRLFEVLTTFVMWTSVREGCFEVESGDSTGKVIIAVEYGK